MKLFNSLRFGALLAVALSLGLPSARATDISSSPLLVASPTSVKANLLFILDDSGSMDFDFMPDHTAGGLCRSKGAGINTGATYTGDFGNSCCQGGNTSTTCWSGTAPFGSRRGHPPFLTSSFNGMAYNPATVYLPPVDATGTVLASQTSWTSVRNDAYLVQNSSSINLLTQYPDTEWCVDDGTFSDCLRNGNYVLPGRVDGKLYTKFNATTASGTGKLATGAPDAATVVTNQSWGPHYYRILPSEYCDSDNLRNCQSGAGGAFTIPAPVRWCNSDTNARAITPAAGSCQAVRTDVYTAARYPTKYASSGVAKVDAVPANPAKASFTFSLSGCSSSKKAGIGSVVVTGVDLLGGVATGTTNSSSTLATSVRDGINSRSGSTGYTAVVSSSKVTISAPLSAGDFTGSVSMTRSAGSNSSCIISVSPSPVAFSGYTAEVPEVAAIPAGFPGNFERVDIIPSRTSYPKAASRKDCAGATCSYAEEMTNFANWWTYYHTRMQSMKSSASRAFAPVTNNRRVGYMSINNNTGSDFLNLGVFESTQKTNWFSKLNKAKPNNSTPLRSALSKAGRLYGGKYNGSSLNGVTVTDPMEYSCQRNFTILSTDGFWNESSDPLQLDNSTEIGDQDSALARPMLDTTGTGNTLADVASYYFRTDLRTGANNSAACLNGTTDVCGNGAGPSGADVVQNMKTFTLGLGASGYMQFRSTYRTDTSGDFYAVREGSPANPSGGVCSWQTTGSCTWPSPISNTLTTIDDLWHAAVNGDGTYFSASDPTTLFTGLASALAAIDVQTKAAAAATTSNPNVAAGDNQVFVSNFSSGEWSGELQSQRLDIEFGTVDGSTYDWSARDKLNANTSRTIYMFAAGESKKRKLFTWGTLSASEKDFFSKSYVKTSGRELSQFCSFGPYCLADTEQTAAGGEALVKYLRGERSNEGELTEVGQPLKYFRRRAHLLGDIVNSEAVFVDKASFTYTDAGYETHKATVDARAGMVYVGANDGMLHAFNSATGEEAWAFIPTLMLPKLYRLADMEYATKHEYFVDGTPTVQDVYDGTQWRTLLVGGLGAGGRGYYALDVTDPADPKALWEFTDDNLGLSVGKPEIGKLKDGTWAVFFGSGYNNTSPGDGKGRLFVLNATTGTLIRSIATSAGGTGSASGMTHIRAWVDNGDVDNTVQRVYGGDEFGNLWRFDVNGILGGGYNAQRLATLKNEAGTAQPITSRPELGQVGSYAMVYVGTGRYLGVSDLSDAEQQSIYAVKDRLSASDFGDPRLPANKFVQQVITGGKKCPANSSACVESTDVRTVEVPKVVNLASDGGWYVDLPSSRERVNTDPQLALGTLVVNSNVIETGNVCKVGGSSFANFLDYATGAPVSTANGVVSVPLGNAIATRPALIKLPNNKVISVSRLSDNRTVSTPAPVSPSTSATRRLSWRDLIQN
ncbi:hypothetical protein LNV08_10960 [Paucibacter sp. TC2R-5]|uniref:pilus assembly protein n=1 Tax=Paucibacter sp. TC2R-5 TaxID=2893555 RepID=UPI0021E498A9|nr:PilC/PilY family type IV pilus protein [Paucibacter sp. TC2R-5]MCV2359495.1 hypothetical protein [Paucibacter sp. TC2R-5]